MTDIRLLEPDLPCAEELRPFLERMDAARWYTNFGPLVVELEQKLHCLFFAGASVALTTVSNGTSALELAVQALHLPAGSRVLLPTYTFPATLAAVLRAGLQPLFSDVDPHNWMLTPQLARETLARTAFTLALPVSTFGNPVDASAWSAFMRETGIPVVVDAAAALGAQQTAEGPLFCFSMHATKPFACGEGGLVVSTDETRIDAVRRLSNFGIRDFSIDALGTNAKMSEYHAAVGLAQIPRWPAMRERRLALYRQYRECLAGCVTFQQVAPGYLPSVLPVMVGDEARRAHCEQQLASRGIQTRRWYVLPLHRTPDMNGMPPRLSDGDFPVAIDRVGRGLGLPFHTRLSDADVEFVAGALREALDTGPSA